MFYSQGKKTKCNLNENGQVSVNGDDNSKTTDERASVVVDNENQSGTMLYDVVSEEVTNENNVESNNIEPIENKVEVSSLMPSLIAETSSKVLTSVELTVDNQNEFSDHLAAQEGSFSQNEVIVSKTSLKNDIESSLQPKTENHEVMQQATVSSDILDVDWDVTDSQMCDAHDSFRY